MASSRGSDDGLMRAYTIDLADDRLAIWPMTGWRSGR